MVVMLRRSPLARVTGLVRKARLRARSLKPKRRAREEEAPEAVDFKAFVSSLPCAGCGEEWKAESHHGGEHGLGEKAHWSTQIPLCNPCHQATHLMTGKFKGRGKLRMDQWERRVSNDVNALYADWLRYRHSGLMCLSTEALLRFSASMAWLKEES